MSCGLGWEKTPKILGFGDVTLALFLPRSCCCSCFGGKFVLGVFMLLAPSIFLGFVLKGVRAPLRKRLGPLKKRAPGWLWRDPQHRFPFWPPPTSAFAKGGGAGVVISAGGKMVPLWGKNSFFPPAFRWGRFPSPLNLLFAFSGGFKPPVVCWGFPPSGPLFVRQPLEKKGVVTPGFWEKSGV